MKFATTKQAYKYFISESHFRLHVS